MDFTGISLASGISQVLAFGLIIVGGYAAIWAVDKVIDLISDSGSKSQSHGLYQDNDGYLYELKSDKHGNFWRDY